jgi:[acyl-carrier-protein] S-malonyltransferase
MGKALADAHPEAALIFDQADAALGFSISKLCFEGPDDQLKLTENTQPALLTVSTAANAVLRSRGIAPDFVAGHSLGEYSALVAAGSLDFGDALRLVRKRGQYMQAAVPAGMGAMAALLKLPEGELDRVLSEASHNDATAEIVTAANFNTPDQVVIAGHAAAVNRAVELAKAAGARRAILLQVSAPFHCPLMQPARDGMEPVLRALKVSELKFGVIANVTAEVNRDPARVVPLLLEQITAPVRWEESMGVVARSGITDAIEFGCGRVLMGMMRRMYRTIRVRPLEDLASLKAVSEPAGAAKA